MSKPQWVSWTGYTKVDGETDVFTATVDRIRHMLEREEKNGPLLVSYSGGKDSTVVLEMCVMVAKEMAERSSAGYRPITAIYFDEELIDPDTVELIERTKKREDVDFHHVFHTVRHNIASKSKDCWYPWNPDEADVWAREIAPDGKTMEGTSLEGVKDVRYGELNRVYAREVMGLERYTSVLGTRVQESINRRRALYTKGTWYKEGGRVTMATPIYDWGWRDVWKAIGRFGWEYSEYYEKAYAAGQHPFHQRIAVWGNAFAHKDAQFLKSFYPEFWEKAVKRLPELDAAARYGESKLYNSLNRPRGMSWQDYVLYLIETLDSAEAQEYWKKTVVQYLKKWKEKSDEPFPQLPQEGVRPGFSWMGLAQAISKNDLSGAGGGGLSTRSL